MSQQLSVRKHSVGDLVWWVLTDQCIKCGKIESVEVHLTGEPDYIIFGFSFIEEELYSDPRLAWKELQKRFKP